MVQVDQEDVLKESAAQEDQEEEVGVAVKGDEQIDD